MDVKLSYTFKNWAAFALCDYSEYNPPALCVHMLSIVAMIDRTDLIMEQELGRVIALGVIGVAKYMDVETLLPTNKPGLLWPLKHLLQAVHWASHLQPRARLSCQDAKCILLGPDTRNFAQFAFLMRDAAKRVAWLREGGYFSSGAAVRHFSYIIQVMRVLFALPPVQQLFELPGMAQIAASAIITTCHRITTMESSDEKEKHRMMKLLNEVDAFFQDLWNHQITGGLVTELKRYRGQRLSFIRNMMKKWGHPSGYIIAPEAEEDKENPKDFPQHFIDQLTGRIMQTPVLLPNSGMVMDSSTYICQMLAAAPDPLTGRPVEVLFERLMPLEYEIWDWKARAKARKRGRVSIGDKKAEDIRKKDLQKRTPARKQRMSEEELRKVDLEKDGEHAEDIRRKNKDTTEDDKDNKCGRRRT